MFVILRDILKCGGFTIKLNILLYTIAILIGGAYGYFGYPFWMFLLTVIPFALLFLFLKLYPVFFTENMNQVEAYLLANQKKPIYAFYYALANRRDEEVEGSFTLAISKIKSKPGKAQLQIIYYLYKGNPEKAKKYLSELKPMDVKHYYDAMISIEEGQLSTARFLKERIKKPWYKDAIEAEINLKEGNYLEAYTFSELAVANTKGLQRYILVKNYEKEKLKELITR